MAIPLPGLREALRPAAQALAEQLRYASCEHDWQFAGSCWHTEGQKPSRIVRAERCAVCGEIRHA